MRKALLFSPIIAILALFLVACGTSMANSPVAPDAPAAAGANSAVLSGTVGTGSGLGLGASTTGSVAGLTISVVGSSESAAVDATGRFRLVVIPSDDVRLKIAGPGVDSTTSVGAVGAGDTIEITITVNGSTADIEDSDHDSHEGREIEGRVEAIPPTTAAGAFVVAGKTVMTTASTVFRKSDEGTAVFADVTIGSRVHVKARASTGSVVTATEVNIQNQQTQLPAELNGTVSGFAGTPTAFAFEIAGRHVTGNGATEFAGNSTFADLRNGVRAEVKAEYRAAGFYATRIHVNR